MNVALLAAVIRERARLTTRDHWTRDRLLAYQARQLADLRSFAVANSPFYRDLHRGLEDAPIDRLPSVTKATLMGRFDDVVTDRDVRLADVERYLDTAAVTDRFAGRYRVAATGGTTGRRGVFLADTHEWITVLASYSRAYAWAGLTPGLTDRPRMAVVSSLNPTHQSSIVGATVASRFMPTLRLDSVTPMPDIVASLNEFKPDALVGYASILRELSQEQAEGRLRVRPRAVFSASEVMTDDARDAIHLAFGVPPTNVYAATETAGIASECRSGHMHRYEDLVIAEIVDDDNQPVPAGEMGAKLLVTVLFSRTQPLIRYELSDRVAASPEPPPGDLPYGVLDGIEGREEDVLTLAGVDVRPNVFHGALERLPVAGWQVIQEPDGLRVLLADAEDVDLHRVEGDVGDALAAVGVARVRITAIAVDTIPRTALGKAPLIRRANPSTTALVA